MVKANWRHLDGEAMREAARRWLLSLAAEANDESIGTFVVLMGFAGPASQQWAFILDAVSLATRDDELEHIAAGPMECLLSRHGAECIALVERQAQRDPRFARMMLGVWRHLMSDEVWTRVQRVKASVGEPLREDGVDRS